MTTRTEHLNPEATEYRICEECGGDIGPDMCGCAWRVVKDREQRLEQLLREIARLWDTDLEYPITYDLDCAVCQQNRYASDCLGALWRKKVKQEIGE